MNEIAKREETGVATSANAATANYYTQYGDQVGARAIVGTLLKFSKGKFLAGEDNDRVVEGTRFIAKMDDLMIGWQCWKDNKPTDHVMGRLGEGFQPPKRETLGDDDQSRWEHDPTTGEERDPWQFSNMIPFRLISEHGDVDEGEDDASRGVYTFATSSKGGLGALGKLAARYGRLMRQHPNDWPVVEISSDDYPHKNKQFGLIDFPVFTIVAWVPKHMFTLDTDSADELSTQQQLPLEPQQKPAPAKARI